MSSAIIRLGKPFRHPTFKWHMRHPRVMGVVAKGAKCNIDSCENTGVRSINTGRVEDAGLRVSTDAKKCVLCKTHYKEWKKESKDDRDLERARFEKF